MEIVWLGKRSLFLSKDKEPGSIEHFDRTRKTARHNKRQTGMQENQAGIMITCTQPTRKVVIRLYSLLHGLSDRWYVAQCVVFIRTLCRFACLLLAWNVAKTRNRRNEHVMAGSQGPSKGESDVQVFFPVREGRDLNKSETCGFRFPNHFFSACRLGVFADLFAFKFVSVLSLKETRKY